MEPRLSSCQFLRLQDDCWRTVTSEYEGYLAIDDISLMKGYCPAVPCTVSTTQDSITAIGTWTCRDGILTNEQEKDNKAPEVLVGVAVGVGVLSLSVLIVIGIYVGRRRPFRSSAASTSIKTDLNMTLSNEMSIDTVQEYANVMAGKSESVSPDPSTYDNNQEVQSTHQNRLIKEERVHAVVSTPTRKIAQYTQKEQIYDHLDTGEKVPKLDDETYDHVKK